MHLKMNVTVFSRRGQQSLLDQRELRFRSKAGPQLACEDELVELRKPRSGPL